LRTPSLVQLILDTLTCYRSTAITKQTLQQKFPDLFLLDGLDDTGVKVLQDFDSSHPEEAARVQAAVKETTEDMTHFRANNIVLDAEDLKDALMVPTEEPVTVRYYHYSYIVVSYPVLRHPV